MSTPLEHLQGKYEILEKLQEGGMGAVYKVRHRLLDEIRVIKVMRPQLKRDEEVKARFLREARTAIRLRHKNIAQFYDFSIDPDENAFIVMEFIDGVTFQDLLRRHRSLPLPLILEMGRQTLEALRYLHRRNIVHRDIAPDNLMLSRDDDSSPLVKLIDLGVAKALGGGSAFTVAGTFLGKVRYAAPEQFRTQEGVTVEPRSDLYSFGVVLYELTTGKLPVRGDNLSSLIAGHLIEPPVPFTESDPGAAVPEELRALIMHTLAKRPEERPASAAALSQELAKIQARFPLEQGTVEHIFSVERMPTRRIPVVKPSSTQERLDAQFRLSAPSVAEGVRPTGEKAAPPRRVARGDPQRESDKPTLPPEDEGATVATSSPAPLDAAAVVVPAAPARDGAADDLVGVLVSEVEALLARDDPAAAREALQRADPDLAAVSVVARLEEQVKRRERRKETHAEVGGLLADATLALGMDDDDGAAKHLEEALKLEPNSSEAARLLAQIRRRREERRNRATAVTEAVSEGEAQVAAGRLEEAEQTAERIATRLGNAGAAARLRQRIQEQVQNESKERVAALLAQARQATDEARFADAVATLEEALRIAPEDALVRSARDATLEARHAHEVREQRARALETAVGRVRRLLDKEQLDKAREAVESAVASLGEHTELTRLGQRIEAAVALATAWAAAREAAGEARDLLQRGDSGRALDVIGQAREGVGEHEEIDRFLLEEESVVRAHVDQLRRDRELVDAKGRIQALLDASDLTEAERALAVAEKLFPHDDEILVLRRRLEWAAHEARRASTTKVVTEARRLASEGRYGPAQRLLAEERARHPHDAQLAAAAAELRRDEAAAAVETSLARGDMEGARRALDLADRMFPDDEILAALRERLAAETPSRST